MKNIKETRVIIRLSPYLTKVLRHLSDKFNTSQHSITVMALNDFAIKNLSEEKRKELEELSIKGSDN